ncbi:sulfotransferase [Psychrosphaera sp. B3R10]|uniref:tetratricopeptide repeat-containing sulfotransferase family protein n=1 Tax=unclassified Psychrosphaera TaxID=2641570 RepID=UPI001C0A4E72|nr:MULTISPECIES: tetratricopeptide repeat-containing sulfotransferase family protein [unclassified Psychrosphaera]MBU2880411.1 sulfotransferase [Psychrosphaera sp. I2R16]MBU2987850.1 sulfotransferase [Psychrosphaera sp. B3R10]
MVEQNTHNELEGLAGNSVDSLLDLGWQYLRKQKPLEATQIAKMLSQQFPDHAEACFFNGQVLAQQKQFSAAIACLVNACELAPHIHQWQFSVLNLLLMTSQKNRALTVLDTLSGNSNLSAKECNQLGLFYSQLNKPELAVAQYKRAIQLDPSNNEHHYSLATVLRHCGELIQAQASLLTAIQLNGNDIDAHCLLVDLAKQTNEMNHISALQLLLTTSLSPRHEVQVNFALAKSYEDLAQYSTAFKHLAKGAKIRRQHLEYHVQQDLDVITHIKTTFNTPWWLAGQIKDKDLRSEPHREFKQNASTVGEKQIIPIFILGMPRTGSTLLERVLSAAPNVYAAGELSDFTRLLTEQTTKQFAGDIKSKRDFIRCSSKIDFEVLGSRYLDALKQHIPDDKNTPIVEYVIDKLPFNFLYVGLIKKALPNARIIHMIRDPMDTCYAVYKTLFQQAYPFSYDQQELADYFVAYQDLMAHWQTLPGLSMLNIAYEDLVQTPQSIGKAVFDFCQIDWQAQYIEVQNNHSAVNTASSSQVRQAIHKSSVAKWRHYETELAALKARLISAGITCD